MCRGVLEWLHHIPLFAHRDRHMRQARARAAIGCVCECAYTRAPSAQVIGILLGLGVPYALHRAGLSENPRRHACAHAHARQKQPRVSARNCDAHTVTAYPCWTTTLAYPSPPPPRPTAITPHRKAKTFVNAHARARAHQRAHTGARSRKRARQHGRQPRELRPPDAGGPQPLQGARERI